MDILFYTICIILFLLAIIMILKIIELRHIVYKEPGILSGKKILTVYYSNCGNTKNVAENLHSLVGGDLKEIELIEKYPNNIFKMSNLAREHLKSGYLPEIEDIDVSGYDVIFAGFPIWNFSVSVPMKSFLKNNNFQNKTIIPFYTCSGGASKNKIVGEIKDFTNAKEIKNPLFMFENGIFLVKEQIIQWLNNF